MKKIAVVTGGSKGIGLSIIEKFLANDYQVFNLDIVSGAKGIYKACDMSNMTEVSHVLKEIIDELGQIDVLVCNAGIHFSGNIEQTPEAEFDRVFAINVKGAYAAIQASLPVMKSNNNGAIVIVASDQAIIGKKNSFAYNLTKHALASMAKTTALDYAPFNIRVNALCPGTIETPLYHQAINNYCEKSGANKNDVHHDEASLQPLGRLGQPEEVASYAYFLASDEASFITGSLQTIDGGYTAK